MQLTTKVTGPCKNGDSDGSDDINNFNNKNVHSGAPLEHHQY